MADGDKDDKGTGSEGAGKEGDKGGKDDKGNIEAIAKLTEGMTALAKAVEGIQTNMAAQRAGKQNGDEEEEEEEEENDEEIDDKTLESLPRKQFADHLIGKVSKIIEKQLKGVQKEVSSVKEGVSREKVQEQVMKLAGEHKDFWDWKDEIAEIATEMPGITPARAYKMARVENAEKAKKMDEKYKVGEGKDGGEDTSGKGKKKFGGFTPGSSRTVQNSKMSKTEAAEKAFDEIMGPFTSGEGS